MISSINRFCKWSSDGVRLFKCLSYTAISAETEFRAILRLFLLVAFFLLSSIFFLCVPPCAKVCGAVWRTGSETWLGLKITHQKKDLCQFSVLFLLWSAVNNCCIWEATCHVRFSWRKIKKSWITNQYCFDQLMIGERL